MIDPVAKFVAMLKTRTAVAAAVGTHVYDTDLPRGENITPDAVPAIVVRITPDSEYMLESPIAELGFELHCYGRTPALARAIEQALYTDIHNQGAITVSGVRWLGTWIETPGVNRQDEQTSWEFLLMQARGICAVA